MVNILEDYNEHVHLMEMNPVTAQCLLSCLLALGLKDNNRWLFCNHLYNSSDALGMSIVTIFPSLVIVEVSISVSGENNLIPKQKSFL